MADEKTQEGSLTKAYVLMDGKKHFDTGLGRMVAAGEEIQLTDSQYRAFRDKFYPKGGSPTLTVAAPAGPPADGSGSGAGAVGPSHVPQDVGAATQTHDSNPGNKVPIVGTGPVAAQRPGSSAANTSAATGSPLSPEPKIGDAVGLTSPKEGVKPGEEGGKK